MIIQCVSFQRKPMLWPCPLTISIESRSDSGWNVDCQDNGTWICRFGITPDSGGGYDWDGTYIGSLTVRHVFFLITALVAPICFIRHRRIAAAAQVN
jgi:hypothetical protein